MANKFYYTIRIEKVKEVPVPKDEQRMFGINAGEKTRMDREPIFEDELSPEEAMEFMANFVRRVRYGKK